VQLAGEITSRLEGNVLHTLMLHDALRDMPAEERRAERISRGLNGAVLEALAVARAPEVILRVEAPMVRPPNHLPRSDRGGRALRWRAW
jgi:hypothetical protein